MHPTKRMNMLKGDFENLPSKSRSEIRAFISSTFKDFQLERDYLIAHVYDDLRRHCLENYQKDLILVDMRFGVTDEISNQQITVRTCLNEIVRCQTESIGPTFVAFLSHRYGAKILKPSIDSEHYELIMSELDDNVKDLMKIFYVLDKNFLTQKTYQLECPAEISKVLNLNVDERTAKERTLLLSIRNAVQKLYENGKFNESEKNAYFSSATEQEIQIGLFNEEHADKNCLAFFRNFANSSESEIANNLKNYFESDEQQTLLLRDLKRQVERKLPIQNRHYFNVDILKLNEFNEPFTNELKEYLIDFGKTFKQSLLDRISHNIKENDCVIEEDIVCEVFHHATFCTKLTQNLLKVTNLIENLKAYIDDDENLKPFIIVGPSGVGKSTLIANTVKTIKQEHPEKIVIVRFLGTSRESSTMKSAIHSILVQLKLIFSNEIEKTNKEFESTVEAKRKFIEQLTTLSTEYPSQKIVIVLDSIDQLSRQDYNLEWMFYKLPKNVKIIYSVLCDYEGIVEKLSHQLPFTDRNYMFMKEIGFETAKKMLEPMFASIHRTVNNEQKLAIGSCLINTPEIHPLHVKLLFDISSKWNSSYQVPEEFKTCCSVKDTIKYLFNLYEHKYGKILFSRCIFYLTIFEYDGISESELENILSIDDDVLNYVFQRVHPPIRRFPLILWLRIKYVLLDYITNKASDGVQVIAWFHRTFIEASQEYYKDMFTQSDLKDTILFNIIEYFTERWNKIRSNNKPGEMKDFKHFRRKLSHFDLKLNENNGNGVYSAYRNTKPQKIKLEFNVGNKTIVVYNKRKLNELVNVISMLHNCEKKVELLKKHVYLNYEFVLAKAELYEMDFVVQMHEILVELKSRLGDINYEVKELVKVSEIYRNHYPKIQQNPSTRLVFEVLSRLQSRSEHVKTFAEPSGLILQCRFIKDEIKKDIFRIDSTPAYIKKFFIQIMGPFIFVQIESSDDSSTKLTMIDSLTARVIGNLDLKTKARGIQICWNYEPSQQVNKLSSMYGHLFYWSNSTVYFSSFTNDIISIIQFDNEIKRLILLNTNYMIVGLKNSIVLLKLDQTGQQAVVHQEFKNDGIQLIRSIFAIDRVYPSSFMDQVEFELIMVGLLNKNIEVYKFEVKSGSFYLLCVIESINWNYYGYGYWIDEWHMTWRESMTIDQSFLLNPITPNTYPDEIIVRFAVEENSVIKVIEIYKNGNYRITNIGTSELGISNNDPRDVYTQPELCGFCKNRLVLSYYFYHRLNACVFVYDLGRKFYIRRDFYAEIARCIETCFNTELILTQTYQPKFIVHNMLYKIGDNSINEIAVIRGDKAYIDGINIRKSELRIKNGKLLRIEPKQRLAIEEINYLSQIKESSANHGLEVSEILQQIDSEHILVLRKGKDVPYQVSVVNVTNQEILNSLKLDEYDIIFGCNKDYFVVINRNLKLFFIEMIVKDINEYGFSTLFSEHYDKGIMSSQMDKCFFLEHNPNRIIITLFDSEKNCLQVRNIDILEFQSVKTSLFIVDIKEFEMRKMFCKLTCLSNYLVLWRYERKTIYFVDFQKNLVVHKVEMVQEIEPISEIICVPGTNDAIINLKESIYCINFNKSEDECKLYKLKEYKSRFINMKIDKNILVVTLWTEEYTEIYRLENVVNEKALRCPIVLNKQINYRWKCCISMENSKYLIVGTRNTHELLVYRLNDLKQITGLQLNDKFSYLTSSDKYISIIYKSKLLSFLIVDSQNDDHPAGITSEKFLISRSNSDVSFK